MSEVKNTTSEMSEEKREMNDIKKTEVKKVEIKEPTAEVKKVEVKEQITKAVSVAPVKDNNVRVFFKRPFKLHYIQNNEEKAYDINEVSDLARFFEFSKKDGIKV